MSRAERLIQRVASAQLAVAELPPGMPRTEVSDTIDEARAFARNVIAASPASHPAAPEPCAHDYVRRDRVCIECGEKTAAAPIDEADEPTIESRKRWIMERIPTVARLYYTGIGARRYRRASTQDGPGEPLVHRSHAAREIHDLLMELTEARPAPSPADERAAFRDALALVGRGEGESSAELATIWSAGIQFAEARAASANDTGAEGAIELPHWFEMFLTNVCEIPDRNSPGDEPDAIVATLDELRNCAMNAIEQCVSYSAPMSAMAAAAPADERAAFEAKFPVPQGVEWAGDRYTVRADYDRSYRCDRFVGQWKAWQARAAASPAAEVAQWQSRLKDRSSPVVDRWVNISPDGAKTLMEKYAGVYEVRALSVVPQPAQADAPAEAREPAAWVTPEGDRSITQTQKQGMLRDGGASASSVRPYSIPCYAGSAPADAGEARLTDDLRTELEWCLAEGNCGPRTRAAIQRLLNGADQS
ncbi:hypothetical protein WS58_06280 [Burkholderia pseudomultivorans]|nr:hypothetical protein WS58_06280 [Burkholderia pseudomultivorans]